MRRKKQQPKSDISAKETKRTDETWKSVLEATSINDEHWWCVVTTMIETMVDHAKFVSLFDAAVDEGKRRVVRSLSHSKVLAAVKQLAKHDRENSPVIQRVCHYCNDVLKENDGSLPTWLMARVIKFLVYRMKMENIGREKRRAELRHEIDEEYRIMQNVVDFRRTTDEGARGKALTKLRKRDEEWRDISYVEDAPLNGPDLYIVLTGFHDPDLPVELITVGIPLICILRIKNPPEISEVPVLNEQIRKDSLGTRKMQFLGEYRTNESDIMNFWEAIEKHLKVPVNHSPYWDIALLNFFPPKLLEDDDGTTYESLKRDIYDKVSYTLYDLYDLYRQHANYLKSMRLEKRIADCAKENFDTSVYKSILNAIPLEHVSVPVILAAMLLQIEEHAGDRSTVQQDDTTIQESTNTENESTEERSTNEDPLVSIRQKVKLLDLKYELQDDHDSNGTKAAVTLDPELTLHADNLDSIIRHFRVEGATKCGLPSAVELVDRVLQILQHPKLTGLWQIHAAPTEPELRRYSDHLDRVRRYFDTNVQISAEEVRHYLHVCVFDKLISDRPPPNGNRLTKNANEERFEIDPSTLGKAAYSERKQSDFSNGTLSETRRSFSFASLPTLNFKGADGTSTRSDTRIDYDRPTSDFVDCRALFDLLEPRELLLPGYLENSILERKRSQKIDLEEYEHVELLPRKVFLQSIYECLLSFDRFVAVYFEPTDTVLLHFTNEDLTDEILASDTVSSIRTPVRFREFCEYITTEEEAWIEREVETNRVQRIRSTERLMRGATEEYVVETTILGDEHFILPGSLKARDLEARDGPTSRQNRRDRGAIDETGDKDTIAARGRSGENETTKRANKERAEKTVSQRTSSREKKREDRTDDVDAAFLPARRTLSFRCAEEREPHEFVGYDLGRFRVQVTNRKKTFPSRDYGALVRVEIDEWLHRRKHLCIAVDLRGHCLRLLRETEDCRVTESFHLTTKRGAVLAFGKLVKEHQELPSSTRQGMNFDFRGSCPSGLLIEPITGDGAENPFYIRQSYVPGSRPSNETIREVCRKFLRNGTVLKYFDDRSVVVLRPNGVVVTCTAFDKPKRQERGGLTSQTSMTTGDSMGRGSKRPSRRKRRPTDAPKSKSDVDVEETREIAQSDPLTVNQGVSSVSSISDDSDALKVSRYTVLNHDGRQYEVLDGLLVSEHHRLLVRTASNYEVNEKFTRRADGTDMLLNSNGELIVNFPDGTRITTAYRIEAEPALCDWSEEEIRRYFIFGGTEARASHTNVQRANSKSARENSTGSRIASWNGEVTGILIADGFVSVLLTCRMEHKNYASVVYDQSQVNCTLSMPDDLRVSISAHGHYEVSTTCGVNLKVEEESLTFSSNSSSDSASASTYNFWPILEQPPRVIFTSTDTTGNILEVKDDGTTVHRTGHGTPDRPNDTAQTSQQKDEVNSEEGDFDENDAEKPVGERLGDQERQRRIRCRIFAMNRDLTAYEYLHRSVVRQTAADASSETSLIAYPISCRPELRRRLITLEPVEHESRSKNGTTKQPCPGKVELLRSTYSIPYHWLFPFGRRGNGIWRNTHDAPLVKSTSRAVPELLKIRVLRAFKVSARNGVIDLRRALRRYWLSLARGLVDVRSTPKSKGGPLAEVASACENLENDLRELALGVRRKIDGNAYVAGLRRKHDISSVKAPGESIELVELLRRRALARVESEWYKRCMRQRIVVPYFQSVAGMCFLWLTDCVEEALEFSRLNRQIDEDQPNDCNEGGTETV